MAKNNNKKSGKWFIYLIIFIIVISIINSKNDNDDYNIKPQYDEKVFSIISSSENKILDSYLKEYASKKNIDINITYDDTLEVIERLNSGEKYDAIFMSNSIWLSMLDTSKVKTSLLRSTSITPVIFGIKDSKAESLGFKNKKIYTKDILDKVKEGKLTFSMANPLTTNSGASAYFEILSNLAGNPEVLKSSHLKDSNLKRELKEFFNGIKRTSGDEDFLESSFVNGDYDAAFTYESSIIDINKKLSKQGKETLYAVYPVDGVAISDSPFVFIENKIDNKKEMFESIQNYLLSSEGQKVLLDSGRRTWYGGVNKNAPKDTFNPSWGINTTEYITPIKYPSVSVINEAFALYKTEFKKPVHVVFCLDYSGSMYGSGISELRDAMEYVLTTNDLSVNFSNKDKIDVIPFASRVLNVWSTSKGLSKKDLLDKINNQDLEGSTALYDAAIEGLKILEKEDEEYISSIILMTDGQANVGSLYDLKSYYNKVNKEIPIYSITFGYASEEELKEISNLTNGKVFDGKVDLTKAFKKVRGYN